MPATARSKNKKNPSKKSVKIHNPRFTAATADRHDLYQLSVQNVESEIDFVTECFKQMRGRELRMLREDFAGTANTSCEFVRRHVDNRAVAVDLDRPTIDWGIANNIARLDDQQRPRVAMVCADVRDPGEQALGVEAILAMNFSYWIFQERAELRRYFESVRHALADDGVFFLDFYGGYEAMSEQEDERWVDEPEGKDNAFIYVWDQHSYNPITGEMHCFIHFRFPDDTEMKKAFSYTWRLWTLPEIREILAEAGFKNITVHCEGTVENDEGEEEGDGVFVPATDCDADAAFISYITAEKP